MLSREFQVLERYLGELEALRLYPQVRRERDSLAREVSELRQRVTQLERELKGEASARKELSSRLKAKEAEATEVAEKLGQAQRELSELKDFKAKLAGGDELSLEGMRALFLQAEEKEIENRVKERFTELEKDFQSRLPALVHQRLVEVLKSPRWPPEVEAVINAGATKMAEAILRDRKRWPQWFKGCYLKEVRESVSKGLDSEFAKRVETEAVRKLEAMQANAWNDYVAEKARGLATGLRKAVAELQGTWRFTCDRCGRRIAVEIGPSEIGSLLQGATIEVACTACSDPASFPFILSTAPHKISDLSLGGLLRLYIGGPPAAG